ncbi:4-hydroxythreonine-4-phosphate dehydrogenase PdxA [Oceanicella actignis]|uniref:4-hydroxythreonine-4-phosphate dehydrogenase n=1 Tax=Oceanicella actignis TaxID=1189325 RepID=A0A1M7RYG7_9RHOB|nr:4-hydroxythreonine-4-phosphate dehydrogenase [Oceanicella actignis]SHN51377.1 4-hydroxythreonine-4-phosphate dehydrogenase [Oceanicella actignis]
MTPAEHARPGGAPPPIAVSGGDPAGIGPEIAAAAWRALSAAGSPVFAAIGDAALFEAQGAPCARIAQLAEAPAVFARALPVLHRPLAAPARPGRPDPANAPCVVAWIEEAVRLALSGAASAVTTLPINKKALKDGAGFAFPGHTEFLADLCGAGAPTMMLAGPTLRVVPVTIHEPLACVPALLSAEAIERAALHAHQALRRDFGLRAPRLAAAGLNPHAGEGGAMGREEIELIAPALARLRARGVDVAGPLPADAMFHPAARARWDAALCMYHDQALIPFKTLDFDEGVNLTLGLPIVRTSPDHGTAYDIAGRGVASARSLIAALRMAAAMARARRAAAEDATQDGSDGADGEPDREPDAGTGSGPGSARRAGSGAPTRPDRGSAPGAGDARS